MQAYRIADEPKPGAMQHLTVNPIWPLLGVMFGGAWLSWPWSVFNGIAMGSPTLKKEIVIAVIGFVGAVGIVIGSGLLADTGFLDEDHFEYALLALTVYKLGISYWMYVTQAPGFSIYEYFGGIARNGVAVLILAYIFGPRLFLVIREQLGPLVSMAVR